MSTLILDDLYANELYSDELISATELNRQPGRILDKALEHPVTITRNDQYFALTRREFVATSISTTRLSKEVVEVLLAYSTLIFGEKVGLEHPCGWLNAFDVDELKELMHEIVSASRPTNTPEKTLEKISVIIHEWHESALAISSPALAEAFSDSNETDEVPLTRPNAECVA